MNTVREHCAEVRLSAGGDVRAVTTYVVNDGVARGYGEHPPDPRKIVFHDMRGRAVQPTLGREGFLLARHPSAVRDFADHSQVIQIYLPEIRELVRRLTGTSEVYMQQNWVFRGDDRAVSMERVGTFNAVSTMQTHGLIHADYHESTTAELLAKGAMLADQVTERPRGRLLGINTWRVLSPPPQDRPLALCDRTTVSPEDFVDAPIIAGPMRLNAIHSRYSERQRFCWWSNMQPDEVLVFIQHEQGWGPNCTVLHTAFSDPGCPAGATPRQSIEARAYAFIQD